MDLTVLDINKNLPASCQDMLRNIQDFMPTLSTRVKRDFGKRQSQFMDSMLTVSHATPLRNARQVLSEIDRSVSALRESYFKKEETLLDIEEAKLLNTKRGDLKVRELTSQLEASEAYTIGAIRKIQNNIALYKAILKKAGKEEFTEKDFEEEEEKYHIMKAFEQAICAARSHGGVVDEGNQIYFHQIGINGSVGLHYVQEYLKAEADLLNKNKEPTHKATLDFLEAMYKKFKGSAQVYATWKGMDNIVNQDAMIEYH